MAAIRAMGVLIGVGICVAALLLWRVEPSSRSLGADVRLIVTPPGELEVKPTGVVVSGRGMTPGGDSARGSFDVRNLVGRPVRVRLRGLPSSRALDRDLLLTFRSGGRTVAEGTAGTLRSFNAGPGLRLGPALKARIDAEMRLRRGHDRFAGQIVEVSLELEAEPAGR